MKYNGKSNELLLNVQGKIDIQALWTKWANKATVDKKHYQRTSGNERETATNNVDD